MLTDPVPRKGKLAQFNESDRTVALALPAPAELLTLTESIEAGMKGGEGPEVRVACEWLLQSLSRFYQVPPCGIRVLASRPLRIRENWSSEPFGDYDPSTIAIRVWMRTAVKKEITSFGTFSARFATNIATISTFSFSSLPIPGVREGFTNVRLRSTTMPVARHPSDCFGCQSRAGAGESTGRAPIAFRGRIRLISDGRTKDHSRRHGRLLRFSRAAG